MLELVLYVWLLGATLVFVGVAMTGEASERFEPLWLLALAAAWPFIAIFMAAGALLVAISAIADDKR